MPRDKKTKGSFPSFLCCFPSFESVPSFLPSFGAFNFSTVSSAPPKLHSTPSLPSLLPRRSSPSSSSSPRIARARSVGVKSQRGGAAGDRARRGRAPDSPPCAGARPQLRFSVRRRRVYRSSWGLYRGQCIIPDFFGGLWTVSRFSVYCTFGLLDSQCEKRTFHSQLIFGG